MNSKSLLVLVPALAGFCFAQETPRPQPSFSLTVSGPHQDFKVGSPIALKVTLTNTSDHDISGVIIPNGESKTKLMRTIDLKVYDSSGSLVPETPHGRKIRGREMTVVSTAVSYGIKPGKSTVEDADLTEEFELHKPGKYTVQAERLDPYSKERVKSNAITITLVE
jgi:hypothetical protein